jgi:uroporphyrinogen-III synthase
MKISTVLITQPEPRSSRSPYPELARKLNIRIDYRPFIVTEGISADDFQTMGIRLLDHTAVIFTSRTAVDHLFRLTTEMNISLPATMKYFCISESIAFYLKNLIPYRKPSVFHGNGKFDDLLNIPVKYKSENFLVPLSDKYKVEIPTKLTRLGIRFTQLILYKTVISDLRDLQNQYYDVIVFFSPSGIKSLLTNFPDFKQHNTLIAAFGPTTAKAVKEMGLRLDISAPAPGAPSMAAALENYIRKYNRMR